MEIKINSRDLSNVMLIDVITFFRREMLGLTRKLFVLKKYNFLKNKIGNYQLCALWYIILKKIVCNGASYILFEKSVLNTRYLIAAC